MKTNNILAVLVSLSLGTIATGAMAQAKPAAVPPPAQAASAPAIAYGRLPLSFEPNYGQTSGQVQWLARGPEYTLFLSGHDAVLEMNRVTPGQPGTTDPAKAAPRLQSTVVRMNLLGAAPSQETQGEEPQTGKANYLTGNDPSQWQKNVPLYGKVRLRNVYPGIDLVYYGRQGRLEYDFVVAPGADPSPIRWGFDGAQASLGADGDVVLHADGAAADVRLDKPVVYQMKDGVQQPVDGAFVIGKDHQAGFRLGSYDKSRELVIDPTLVFVGAVASGQGNNSSAPNGMAIDANGEIVLTGKTTDDTFPVTTGAYSTVCDVYSSYANQTVNRCPGGGSAYITKISADGTTLIFSTYLHGISGDEYGEAVAINSVGDEVILGATSSYDFPVTSDAYQNICQPRWNGTAEAQICDGYFSGGGTEYTINGPVMFVAKLDPTGANLIYATFVGGTSVVYPEALALDSQDNIYFAGFVQAAWSDAQVYPNNGNQAIAFPTTTNAFQQYGEGEQAASLSVLKADGSAMLYSTLFGSDDSKDEYLGYDMPNALAVGPNGMAYMGGTTTSAALPTTPEAIKPSCTSNSGPNYSLCETTTAWLAAFDTSSASPGLTYATYIGGTETDAGTNNTENQVLGLHADKANDLFVTGWTSNIDFPTTAGVYQTTCNHANNANTCNAAVLMKLNPSGGLTWSTYYGGTNGASQSTGNAIALDSHGWVYLYGYNNGYGWDLPMVNPLEAQNGSNFAFVATFTGDAKTLLFATPMFGSCCSSYATYSIPNNGIALDSSNNIYVAGYGNDWGALVTTPGTYDTTGSGSGWRGFFGKISPVLPWTATTLTAAPAPAQYGQTITFTTKVAGVTQSTPVPTGTVTLQNVSGTPATTIGTATLGASGTAVFTTSSLPIGTYSVTASYPGDENYEMSVSAAKTLTVTQATPLITWVKPAAIVYGTALSATEQDATANTAGTFAYSPATGTVLAAGAQTLSVTFTPTDTTDYKTATATVTLTVNKATPQITWPTPAQLPYGTAVSATQEDATSPVAGTFTYSPAAGWKPAVGTHTITATFTPTNTADYKTATATVTLTVIKAAPVITWPTPAAITYGTKVGPTQQDATANVAGTFVYAPAAGWVPIGGTHTMTVTFTPANTTDYKTATATVTLTVNPATPSITWATPAAIPYGRALSATQLDATSKVAGTFAYTPAAGTVLTAGTQTLSVTFTPTSTTDYTTATTTVSLTVARATPVVTWPTPAPITYGTKVGPTQQDATANVPGTFAYSPAAGWEPAVGTHTMTVTFTPTDTTDYKIVTATVTLTVNAAS